MPDSALSLAFPLGGAGGRRRRGEWLPLFLLIGAAAVPIVVFATVMLGVFNRQMESSLESLMRHTARWSVAAVDARLSEEVAALQALAAGERDSFPERAAAVMTARPSWLGLRLAEVGGTAIDVAGRALPPLDALTVRRVSENGRPEVGAVQGGAEPIVPVYVPVSMGGRTAAVLAVAVSTLAISEAIRQQPPPAGWVVAALDAGFAIAGRSEGHERFVGTSATPSLIAQLNQGVDHFFFSLTRDGVRAYTAASRSAVWGWTVAVGAPAEAYEGPMRRTMVLLGGGGLLALGLAMFVGVGVARGAVRRQDAERRLVAVAAQQRAERRLTDIASNFPGVIYRRVLQPDGRVTYPYVSPGAETLGKPTEFDGDQPASHESLSRMGFVGGDREAWLAAVLQSSRTLQPFHFEGRTNTPDGSTRWIRTMARPSLQSDGAVVWDGVALDITDMKQAEEHLAESLAEKDRMLREIHHRVRNNLQVVSSLIQIETFQIADADARRRLAEVSRRIGALGHVHELLYRSTDFARIDCGEHLRRLCAAVQDASVRNAAVVDVAAQALHSDLDTAIPFGLIAHELVTQELVHTSQACVRLERGADGAVVLTLTSSADGQRHDLAALCSRILHALAAQIDAKLTLSDGEAGVATLRIDGKRFAA